MLSTEDYRQRFINEMSRKESEIDLIEATLLIAGEHNPTIDIPSCRSQITRLAEGARFCVHTNAPIEEIAAELCKYLYQNQGFKGNADDYDNPDNSFLDKVLESHKGIPISIAIIYMGVGHALGLKVKGISFPGHFLIKIIGEREIIIDPFHGKINSRRDCITLLRNAGEPAERLEHYLKAASNKEIILRILNNLKLHYLSHQNFTESLTYCERRLLLEPESLQDVLDRGLILEQLECFQSAISQLEHFLSVAPDVSFAPSIRTKIEKLRTNASQLQ
ncbi:MAG: tetratricopeptide repeat protein [Pseudomonadales bacterium]|nr:tetratricopeptide repeat protein [Pseudomonadales bacterium]